MHRVVRLQMSVYSDTFQISQAMDSLVAEHPGLVSKVTIGYSFEKRPMNVLKVHSAAGRPPPQLREPRGSRGGCPSGLGLQSTPGRP